MTRWVFGAKGSMGPKVYRDVPDGGWGWVVAVAFFLVEVFTYGVIKSFGIFLKDLMSEFDESNSRVSWIISICVFVMTFTAPLSSVLSNRFGFQPVVMLGGFLISMGTISSAFTNSIDQMYITYGIVAGLGYCLTFLPTITILSQYFRRRRSLVTAMASTGESCAIFAFAPAFTALKANIGWRYTLVVIGVLQATIIVCGALLRPIVIKPRPSEESGSEPKLQPQDTITTETSTTETSTTDSPIKEQLHSSVSSGDSGVQSLRDPEQGHPAGGRQGADTPPPGSACQATAKEEGGQTRPKFLDLSVLREGSFLCYSAFGLFATLGFFAPQLYVVELSASRGMERTAAAYVLSAMAIAEILGRLSVGWVLSWRRVCKLHVLLACVASLCLVLALFPLAQSTWALVACCAVYGFLLGCVVSTHIPMLAEDDVVGITRMPSAVGVYVCIQSFAGLAGPPLGGVLVDITQNYGSAFYSCAVGMGLGALFLGLVRPVKTSRLCTKSKHQERQDNPAVEEHASLCMDTPEDFLEVDVELDTKPADSSSQDSSASKTREHVEKGSLHSKDC